MKINIKNIIKSAVLIILCAFAFCSCSQNLSGDGIGQPKLYESRDELSVISAANTAEGGAEELMRGKTENAEIVPTALLDVLSKPNGIVLTDNGDLFVTDLYNRVVWRVSDGKSEIYAGYITPEDLYGQPLGGYNDAARNKSAFKTPWAAAPFMDGLAVSDTENNVIRLIRENGVETLNARTETGADATVFNHPTGLAADEEGNLYVAETFSDSIRMISPDGTVTTVVSGVSEPTGVCIKDSALYIAESGANRISVYKDGALTVLAGSGEDGFTDGAAEEAEFSSPQGIAVDGSGTIYVADTANSAIRMIKSGRVSTLISRDVTDINEFFPIEPTGLAISDGTLYVCDPYACKLLAAYV